MPSDTGLAESCLNTDFLFAEDCALCASHEEEMQAEIDSFSSASDNFALIISTKKTEVMFQPAT